MYLEHNLYKFINLFLRKYSTLLAELVEFLAESLLASQLH